MTTSIDGRWELGIGDPTAIGWATVAAYGTAMALCYLSSRKLPPGPHRQFWFYMMIIMALLGINKQLDLQSWFTQTGRDLALENGWYERRRLVQVIFVAWLVLAGLVTMSWLKSRLRHLDRYARRAAIGLVLLAVFVIVRATSFHHIDRMLGISLEGLRVNALLELSGIGLIAMAALARLRAPQTQLSVKPTPAAGNPPVRLRR